MSDSIGMAKSANTGREPMAENAALEPRPFLYTEPVAVPARGEQGIEGVDLLTERTGQDIPSLVRSLVNHTIALQNRSALLTGHARPIAISVLNRRRRSARAWLLTVMTGQVDRGTLHSLVHTWIPQLAGTGPEIAKSLGTGLNCIEFVRGAMTALIFQEAEANLIPAAKALHALETVLGIHMQALREACLVAGAKPSGVRA